MSDIEQKIVFGLSHTGIGDGVPLVMLGIPEGAWEYMKDGKTHTFDLTKAGVPVKLILFGGKDHAEVKGMFDQMSAASGQPYLDARRTDFAIKPKGGK